MDVSRETEDRLKSYYDLLTKWTKRINLVSRATLEDGWRRHVLDSAQLVRLAPEGWRHWVDLGSGGGLPGVVVAIIAAEKDNDQHVTLVESDVRKAAFLRAALREVGVGADVVAARIEEIASLEADVVSARALAPLPRLLDLSHRHIKPGGTALFPKGKNAGDELQQALERWSFACEKIPSETDSSAVILKIGDIRRA